MTQRDATSIHPMQKLHHSIRSHRRTFKFGTPLSHQGFTIIELMVVVAIFATLVALAAPSFRPLVERWRVRDAAETLQSTIYYARSEAIKRSGNVIIMKGGNTASCSTGTNAQWSCGWSVFFDANGNGIQDACVPAGTPNECELQRVEAPTRLDINLPGSTGKITVDRWGMLSNTGGAAVPTAMSFELIPKDKAILDVSAVRVCVASSGRIARKKGSDAC